MLMTLKKIGKGDSNCHGVMFNFFGRVAREVFIDKLIFK